MLSNFFSKLTFHFTHTLQITRLPAIILETISCLQIFHLFLREIFSSPVGHQLHFSDFLTKLTSLTGTFQIFCSENSFCWLFESLCFGFVGYILIATLLTFSACLISNENYKLKNLIAAVLLVHSRVIYFSSTYFFLKILTRNEPYYDSEIFRWWVLIAVIFNWLLSLIQELFFHQLTNIKNAYATTNNYFHQLVFSQKTISLLCHFLTSSLAFRVIASVLNILIIMLILYILYNKLPFYRIELFKISLYIISGSFGLSIINFVKTCFSLEENILEPLTFVFVPLFMKIVLLKFRLRSNKILEGRFRTPEEAIHFCILLKKYAFSTTHPSLYLQKIPKSCLVSNGILQFHKLDLGKVTQHNHKEKYEECVYNYMIQRLEEILPKNSEAHFLVLYVAKIYIKRFSNESKALRLISGLKQHSRLKETLKRFEYFIRMRTKQQGQSVDITLKSQLYVMEYFEYKKKFELAQEYIGREITHQIQFWQTMKKEKVPIQTLLQESEKINDLFHKIQYIFDQQLFENQISCCMSYILYAVYLQLIRGFPEDPRLLRKFFRLRKDSFLRHMLDVYSEGTAAIITCAQIDRVDRVLDISGSTHTFFGVYKSHLVGNSLRSLFPSVFVKHHIQFLQDFVKSSDSTKHNKYTTCVKNQNGDLFEVEIEARLCHVDDGLGIMQIFRKIGISKSMMIVGHDGGILECSKNVMESLHLEVKEVNQLKLHNLCPYFYVVNNAFNVTHHTGGDYILSTSVKRTLTQQLSPRRTYLPTDTLCRLIESPRSPTGKASELDCGSPGFEMLYGMQGSMAEDKEKEICESYQRGNKLKLWIAVDENNPRVEVECDVVIVPHVLDGRVFKVLTFQNIEMSIKSQLRSLSSKKDISAALIIPQKVMVASKKTSFFIRKHQTLSPKIQGSADIETEENPNEVVSCSSSRGGHFSDHIELSKLRMQANSQAQGSIHSSSTEKARCIRALHQLFDQKESFRLAGKFLWMVYLLGLINLGMITINFVYSRTSVHEIRDGIDINKTANLRLCAAMIAWEQVSRILIRGQGLKSSTVTGVAIIESALEGYRMNMVQENEELSRRLSLYQIQDLIEDMFERDVNFWFTTVNDTYSSRGINIFTGNDIIANKFKAVYHMSYSDIFTPVGLGILGQAVNITANDYLAKSEELIEVTQNLLYRIVSNNLVALKAILGGEFFILGIFIVTLCLTARKILSNQKILVDIIRKTDYTLLKERIEKLNKMKVLLNEDIENEEGISKILKALHKSSSSSSSRGVMKSEMHPNNRAIKSHEYNLIVTRLTLILVKYIVIAIIAIMVVSGSFLESLFDSISYFNSVERINTQIGVVSRGKYQISALTSSFYTQVVYTNSTDAEQMLIRNKDPESQVQAALSFFGGLNSRLLEAFSVEENQAVGVIRSLLQDQVCKYLTDFDQKECELGTFGFKMGVLEMNLYFSNMVKGYAQRFNGEPTFDIGKSIMEIYHVTLRNTIDTLENTYEYMINYVIERFKQEADEFLSRKTTRFVVILGIILASTLIIQMLTLKKFEELERGRGKILKLVPLEFIETNKILSLYLKRQFNRKGQVLLNWI